MDAPANGRPNQRRRTRKALLEAAARLASQGRTPALEEVATEALVSRATAYRYFPSVEALMVEASLDIAFPSADQLFADGAADPAERLRRAEAAVHAMTVTHEPALRLMLAHSLNLARSGDGEQTAVRQNRRTPLIEAALAPARDRLGPAAFDRLCKALALVIGTESLIVCKDVLGIEADEAAAVKLWAVDALLAAALHPRPDAL
jgi:AcrR family transcriptional regulator